jgi:hypothetical protein
MLNTMVHKRNFEDYFKKLVQGMLKPAINPFQILLNLHSQN